MALIAACCVEFEYTYTSGNPPKHKVKVSCDCLSISLKNGEKPKVPISINGKVHDVDYIVYTIESDPKSTSEIGLIVSE